MKAVRAVALSRHAAPDFVALSGLEVLQLRKLPHLHRALYQELVSLSDLATGRVETSYAVLEALLDFDLTPKAHAIDKASVKRIRTALEQLQALGLVRADPKANRRERSLVLYVQPRASAIESWRASKAMSGRDSGRVRKARKPALARVPAAPAPDERQDEGQGVQEEFIPPSPPVSTGTRTAAHAGPVPLGQWLEAIAAEGEKLPPPGGANVAPCGRTPPKAKPSPTVRAMQAQLKAIQKDEGEAPSARLERRRAGGS